MNTSSLFHKTALNFIKEVFLTAEVCYGTTCLNFARGSRGILPQKGFKFGGSETLFSALVMKCVRKIGLEYENGKQLQVTIIKITESKENKSIHRLNVSGSTGSLGNERKKSKALT